MVKSLRALAASAALMTIFAGVGAAQAADVIGLITKTNTNPFFVKMKQGAEAEAKAKGYELHAFAGKFDGDNESQVAAIESLIASKAKGILITASDTKAIVPAVKKARDAGIIVIALDTPLDPIDAADQTFATDNFEAGKLIGAWAKGTLGDKAATAKIAMLDINASNVSVDVARDTGFLTGFGIKVPDLKRNGSESDPRVVGHEASQASEEGGRKAIENLLQKDPDLNVVYTINEPAAAGAYAGLKAAGKAKSVLVVSVDGGCPGVKNVQAGIIGATSQQYPLLMASKGVDAIDTFAKTGAKPKASEGLSFFNTGVNLVTDKPVTGVPSIDVKEGLAKCWG